MAPPVAHRLDALLAANTDDTVERIEALIDDVEWPAVRDHLIAVLEDEHRSVAEWKLFAEVFWGAVLDRRSVPEARLIALLYTRLPTDADSAENNLVWSITAKLRNVGYLSDYDPLADPAVRAELASIRKP